MSLHLSTSIGFVLTFVLLFMLSPTVRKEAKATISEWGDAWARAFKRRSPTVYRRQSSTEQLLNEFVALVDKYDVESPYVTAFLEEHKENEAFIQLTGKAELLQQAVELRKPGADKS